MAGHSKWANIRHKKGAADAKRGKVFSKLSKEITSATRSGLPDPDANPRLRSAIAAAKAANMPKDNIDRAFKKGTGELGGGTLEELLYEGYGPNGIGIVIDALTDNRNRTAANIRSYFNKAGLTLADSGSVSRLFHRKARFVLEGEHANEEELFELLLGEDIDVEEIEVHGQHADIIAASDAFNAIVKVFEDHQIPVQESEVTKIADLKIDADAPSAKRVLSFIEILEDDEDVAKVYTNMNITDEVMAELTAE